MRALLHRDYESSRAEISCDLATAWATEPNAVWCTLFDYRYARVDVNVQKVTPELTDGDPPRLWGDWADRVSRSRGRFRIHGMMLREGSEGQVCIIPLRTAMAEVHDTLRGIASMGSDPIWIRQEVRKSLSLRADHGMEIH